MSPCAEQPQADPASVLMGIAGGFHVSRALHLAARLRIADLLGAGAETAAQLARATGTDAQAIARIMRLLVSAGVFAQDEAGAFTSTPLSQRLRAGVPGSLRDAILFHLGPQAYQAWAQLDYSVETGKIAFDRAFGTGVWEYRACHAEYSALFDAAMSDLAGVHVDAILAAYPFGAFRRIVDIGGGSGKLLASVLGANPDAKGALFDLPHVARAAREAIVRAGLGERCEVMEGDVFSGVPAGADAYILSRVIHDWDDARTLRILENCRRAMPPHARLLIMERVLPERIQPSPALRSLLVSDLTMMVMNGGRERTEAEYRALLSASGLVLDGVVATRSGISVLEGRPACNPRAIGEGKGPARLPARTPSEAEVVRPRRFRRS